MICIEDLNLFNARLEVEYCCAVMELFILHRNLRFWHLNPGYSRKDQRKLLCFQYFYFLRLENTQFTVKLSAVFKLMVILSHVILRLLLWSWQKGKKYLRSHYQKWNWRWWEVLFVKIFLQVTASLSKLRERNFSNFKFERENFNIEYLLYNIFFL